MNIRLLVSGTRGTLLAQDIAWLRNTLDLAAIEFAMDESDRLIVVHGDCPTGVDQVCKIWAAGKDFAAEEAHPAANFGPWPAAGPIRNSHMVSLGAHKCLAFPMAGSKGTWDTARKAVDAGIPTEVLTFPRLNWEHVGRDLWRARRPHTPD